MCFRDRNVQGQNFKQPTHTWKHPGAFWLILRDLNKRIQPREVCKKKSFYPTFHGASCNVGAGHLPRSQYFVCVCNELDTWLWFLDEFPHFGKGPHLWCLNPVNRGINNGPSIGSPKFSHRQYGDTVHTLGVWDPPPLRIKWGLLWDCGTLTSNLEKLSEFIHVSNRAFKIKKLCPIPSHQGAWWIRTWGSEESLWNRHFFTRIPPYNPSFFGDSCSLLRISVPRKFQTSGQME